MAITGAIIVPHPPVILPEVGRGREKEIQATIDAYQEAAARVAAWRPETVVILSPHSTMYSDYFHLSPGGGAAGDLRAFGVSGCEVKAEYDGALVNAICGFAAAAGLAAGTQGERDRALDHGVLIPLRFLQAATCADGGDLPWKAVRVGLSGLSPVEHYCLGKCIAAAAEQLGRRVVVVASGDLSHKLLAEGPYGFAPEGPAFDRQVTAAMAAGDFLQFLNFDPAFADAAAECGLRSFQIMAGALDGLAVAPELLSYEGPFGVGYGVAVFTVKGPDDSRRFDLLYEAARRKSLEADKAGEDAYVRLARLSLETFVRTGKRAELPRGLPAEMTENRAGVFVSLKKDGRLRGCIGTIGPATGSVAEEILRNAVSAGSEDPRFPPVCEAELEWLSYSVDVLCEAEPIDSEAELDPARYGVIVTRGRRRGLLLPNLEGVDTAEQQVAIARQKAGIGAAEPCMLERFCVARHK